ncbi:hypothetical protein, partial [Mesorhizobium sp.]|uniref:hypothetical protein n=1 Tax=Mesorhizobium sp. TaxID=1871066 RepID=UPI0025C45F5C
LDDDDLGPVASAARGDLAGDVPDFDQGMRRLGSRDRASRSTMVASVTSATRSARAALRSATRISLSPGRDRMSAASPPIGRKTVGDAPIIATLAAGKGLTLSGPDALLDP